MDLFAVCAVAVVAAVLALVLRRQHEESALFVTLASSVVILLYLLKNLLAHIEKINALIRQTGVNSEYLVILLKAVGLCLLTEFVCDAVSESNLNALSNAVSLAGKSAVIVLAFPLYSNLLNTVLELMQL